MEQFVNGIREFAESIVNFKPFKIELRILKEITGKMFTAKLQSRRECVYIIRLIFPRTFLLGIKLSDIRSQPWCKQRSWSCQFQLINNGMEGCWLSLTVSKLSLSLKFDRFFRVSPEIGLRKNLSSVLGNLRITNSSSHYNYLACKYSYLRMLCNTEAVIDGACTMWNVANIGILVYLRLHQIFSKIASYGLNPTGGKPYLVIRD